MNETPQIRVIGELINNAYGRARTAWERRDLDGYQALARLQADGGAEAINVNVDGTQRTSVRPAEMLEFLPRLIPALQEATDAALCIDNPDIEYHRTALRALDRSKCRAKPILNSLAASRHRLDEMIALVREHDLRCIVMASERFLQGGGSAQSLDPRDSYETVRTFVDRLVSEAGRTLDDIIIDPGLAPVGADTYGLVNIGLDTLRLCADDIHLRGLHYSVGLSNFAWGTPKSVRHRLERAYLTLAGRFGLDFALANVEQNAAPLPADDPIVGQLESALLAGRRINGESAEEAGFRQAEKIMDICNACAET